jgi:diguanylate cyclase (GGDEF)-like protein
MIGDIFKSEKFRIAAVGFGSALLAGISGALGGIPAALITSAACGIACFVLFHIRETIIKGKSGIDSPNQNSSKTQGIPTDRIDQLTGLANENGLKAWFNERGNRLASDNKGIVVLVADLADFVEIEQIHGRQIADAVLIETAKRVASLVGDEGIAAHYAGGHFAAVATVVPSHSAEIAAAQAGKLTDLLQRPVELPGKIIWIGGSVGAAYGSPLAGDSILKKAEAALKRAIKVGRGHYYVSAEESAG